MVFLVCSNPGSAFSQRGNPIAGTTPGAVPLVNVGGGPSDAQFFSLDFAQKVLQEQNKKPNQKELEREKGLVDSGTISALDLAAPGKAVKEFNQASSLLRGQHSQEAIAHLQKAIADYPNFVSAHNYLGLAYLDTDDAVRALTEFQTAAQLDNKFAASYVNMGRLALSENDYVAAEADLQKAAALRPVDAGILTALAYAENGNHEYQEAIRTVERVHELPHAGMGNAHFVAAVAAVSLNDYAVARREFALFLQEDPSNPLAPAARQNIAALSRVQSAPRIMSAAAQQPATTHAAAPPESQANSDLLKAQLAGAADDSGGDACNNCTEIASAASTLPVVPAAADPDVPTGPPGQWTIRKVVDEVAVFFGVTSGGHSVSDLVAGDIKVLDDSKPPEKVLQFTSQSKLPLRLGVLIDTSGSVHERFSFEKHAAAKFLQQMLSNPSDLGFVSGFAGTTYRNPGLHGGSR